jgi:hypothetical protein
VAGYVALGGYATWPLVTNLLRRELYESDPSSTAWALWWTEQCLLHGQDPWHTRAMFAPDGTDLAFHAFAPLLGALWMPVTLLAGPAQAVNLLSIALPVVAACAAYRSALAVDCGRGGAVAAGAFFGFAPITLGRAALHATLAAGMVFLPIALLASIRLRTLGRPQDGALLGAALAAVIFIDQSIALIVLTLVGLYWAGVMIAARGVRGTARLAVVVVCTFVALASPQLYFSARAAQSGLHRADPVEMARSWRIFGTDVLAFVRPGPAVHVPQAIADGLDGVFAAALDMPATTGIAVFTLAVLGAVAGRRRRIVRWAAVVWTLGFVLALGPRIAIGEHPTDYERAGVTPFPIVVRGQPLSALLPYTWLVQVPGLADVRAAQRFAMLSALPAALLAGFGVQWLLTRRTLGSRTALAALLAIAILEMAVAVPAPLDVRIPVARPDVYEPIRRDPVASIVVDVPLGWVTAVKTAGTIGYRIEPLLRATEHGHPIAYGFTNRLSDARLETLGTHPFYAGLIARQYGTSGTPPWPTSRPPHAPTLAAARADRARLGVGWAVVWPDASRSVVPYLEATGFVLSHAAEGFEVYRATDALASNGSPWRRRPRAGRPPSWASCSDAPGSPRRSARLPSSPTCPSASTTATASGSSDRTARGSRRCCGCSPASKTPTREPSRSAA